MGSPAESDRVPVRGVVFDLFGTLTDGRLEKERAALYAELAAVLQVEAAPFARLMRVTFRARCAGEFGDTRETLRRLSAQVDARLTDDALEAAVAYRLQIERRLATPRADAVAVLRALRIRGLRSCVLSDCGPETPAIWPELAFATLIDETIFSCEVGRLKPSPDLYALASTRIGLDPSTCLYVGDGGSRELSGARDAGMRPVRLAAPGEDCGGELRFDPDDAFSGDVIDSLSGVLDMCGARASWAVP